MEEDTQLKKNKYLLLNVFLCLSLLIFPLRASKAAEDYSEILRQEWIAPLMLMTSQLTTTMMHQVLIIGEFFDAKHQLEMQRLFQEKVAQAHKDYHPSEQICEISTFIQNLASTEENIRISRNALQNATLARALASGDVKTMDDQGSGSDQKTRARLYTDKFCNMADNIGQNELWCVNNGNVEQQNADINYTQTIDLPLTLNFDPTNSNPNEKPLTREEENIYSFMDQIFMNDSFTDVVRDQTILHNFIKPYQEMRSLVAMRSVAQNSMAQIIAEKSGGIQKENGDITPFIYALLEEMGLDQNASIAAIGEKPSYYAQMEVLTKKIFQHPKFMVNLYDKPTNVKRIRAALSAIKLMQDRDIYNAMQRREMLTSMILELQLRQKQNSLTNEIDGIIGIEPKSPTFIK